MKYEIFQRRSVFGTLQWYWRLVAANNRKIAVSGEGYHNKQDCVHAIDLVRGSVDVAIKMVER